MEMRPMPRTLPPELVQSPRSYAMRGHRLEQPADKLVLVIDLDETLVYALRKDRAPPPVLSAAEETPGLAYCDCSTVVLGDESFDVLLRPGAVEFLHRMAKHYEIFLYTMGTHEYVAQILPVLDPDGDVFPAGHVCVWTPEHDRTTKELGRVGADERQVVILDDALYAWREHVANLVLITRFVGDRRDSALHVLPQYLRQGAQTMRQGDGSDWGQTVWETTDLSAAPKSRNTAASPTPLTVRLALRESAGRAEGEEPIYIVSEQWLHASICSLWPVDEEDYIIVHADGSANNAPHVDQQLLISGAADE
ncbi:HAD-like domain-containing protein [Pavlovales sp. CCMP2436]|nr:HAD-like domain-containing protein [Pavlovales sp. CCMP2436]